MTVDLLMPKLGLTMTEGVLLEWKVAPGDRFARGDILFVVETDKAATDIEAEADGRLAERLVEEGETVPVGQPVGRLTGETGPAEATDAVRGQVAASNPAAEENAAIVGPSPASPVFVPGSPAAPVASGAPARIVATPLARRMAREGGVDLAAIAGSGPRGRIKAADVERAAASLRWRWRKPSRRRPPGDRRRFDPLAADADPGRHGAAAFGGEAGRPALLSLDRGRGVDALEASRRTQR